MRIVTDTAGTNYNPAAATSVLVGVNNTVASVNTAITAINSGTLTGLVPAAGLISALSAAQIAEAAGQTANTASVNALVTKLAANVAAGTATDVVAANAAATYTQKVTAITTDAADFRTAVSVDSTTVLLAKQADTVAAVTTARAALTAADKTGVATFDAAVATEASALAAKPTAIVKGNVVGGLQADASATAGFATLGTPAVVADPAANPPVLAAPAVPLTAAQVYANYVNGTATQRTAIETAFKDSGYFATFKATVTKDASYLDAVKAKLVAQDALDNNLVASTQTVDGVVITAPTDATAGTATANAYVTAINAKVAADALVVKAQAADVDVAAVKVITDANKVLTDATTKATADITAFNAANTTVKAVAVATVDASATVKETFYFAAKADGADYTIGSGTAATQFAAGDAIVLGSGYTFNSGALTTGNNNALEFFLVKTDTGTQVVVESSVFGSAAVTASATTGVATAADAVSVINLVGVTADHLSVANGVISYV